MPGWKYAADSLAMKCMCKVSVSDKPRLYQACLSIHTTMQSQACCFSAARASSCLQATRATKTPLAMHAKCARMPLHHNYWYIPPLSIYAVTFCQTDSINNSSGPGSECRLLRHGRSKANEAGEPQLKSHGTSKRLPVCLVCILSHVKPSAQVFFAAWIEAIMDVVVAGLER